MSDVEAKLKLSVDTDQAQQQIKLIERELNEIGKGNRPGTGTNRGSAGSESNDSIARLISVQESFFESFKGYLSYVKLNNQSLASKIDKLNEVLTKQPGSTDSPTQPGGSVGSSSNVNNTPITAGNISDVLRRLATGTTIASIVNNITRYSKQSAYSSASSEQRAFEIFNTSRLYNGNYSRARNIQSDIGSKYGYNVYETLGVQSLLIGSTGATTQDNITKDTSSILKTSRAMGINNESLASVYGKLYKNGTYDNGEMSKFANLFATSVKEAGMTGRENEQLEVLESINSLLDKNLTTITQEQYSNAVGLYSMFADSNSSLKGENGVGMITSLNDAITNGGNSMDIALGKYSGKFSSLWEFRKFKENGISDSEVLKTVLQNVELWSGGDLSSDAGRETLARFFEGSGAHLETGQIDTIIANKDKLISGEYKLDDVLNKGEGDKVINENYKSYTDSKLEDMNKYEAESLNAQERIGDAVNEATSHLKAIYNDLPQWLQNVTSGTGGVLGGVANMAGGALAGFAGQSLISKIVGGGTASVVGSGIASAAAGGATGAATGAGLGTAVGGAGITGLGSKIASGASGLMSKATGFLTSHPGITATLGAFAPALGDLPRMIENATKEVSPEAQEFYNWSKSTSPSDVNATADKDFKDMMQAAQNGNIKDWAKKYVSERYRANPTSGDTWSYDTIINRASAILGGSTTTGKETRMKIKTADDAIKYYESLSKEDIEKLSGIDSLSGSYTDLENKEKEAAKNAAKANNYYSKDELSSTPFYGKETAFGWDNEYYSTDDLKKLKNTMIKDYVENGSVAVGNYFGRYNHHGGDYASEVNRAIRMMFGKDTGVSSNWFSEVFKGQNETGEDLSEGLNSILEEHKDEYESIINGNATSTEANTSALERNTEALNKASGFGTSSSSSSSALIKDTEAGNSKSSFNIFTPLRNLIPESMRNLFSHATGADYIPYDGYIAELHKGETVLDAYTADKYRKGNLGNSSSSSNLLEIRISGSIQGMNEQNQNKVTSALVDKIRNSNNDIMRQLAYNTVRTQN